MAAVDDGGVVFKISSTDTQCDQSSGGDLSWNVPPEELARSLKEEMATSLQGAVGAVENNLMNALADQHRLFLPAKGSFLMKDPVFNGKGDLMVKLAYNG